VKVSTGGARGEGVKPGSLREEFSATSPAIIVILEYSH